MKLRANICFQVLLVKKIEKEKGRITTRLTHAQPKKGAQVNKALRGISTEESALKLVTNYCRRNNKNKGLLPGEMFKGVILKKYEMHVPSGGAKVIPTTMPQDNNKIGKGKPIMKNTAAWLYYIDPSCKRFHVVTTPDGEHLIGEEVKAKALINRNC
jgi:hypothetical protein